MVVTKGLLVGPGARRFYGDSSGVSPIRQRRHRPWRRFRHGS
jgi:hypothetical protein